MKYLINISGDIPHAGIININIPLNGRNLIITGKNGSGKTSFLKKLEKNIQNLLENQDQQLIQHRNNIIGWTQYRDTLAKTSDAYFSISKQIENEQKKIEFLQSGFQITFNNIESLQEKYDNFRAIFKSFPAMRTALIDHTTQTTSLSEEKVFAKQNFKGNFSSKLEQHLINIKTSEAYAKGIEKDYSKGRKFEEWFNSFDTSLQKLFENEAAKLEFSFDERKFRISDGFKTASFQDLSSGYSAIFEIYADLLLRTEFFETTPIELEGIVLIDEIDAHLHISLQKLILPFFKNSFPHVQFIVSTHSPFVITSTDNDTVVYDISSGDFYEDDLSKYSVESIIKELFHVETDSLNLKNSIDTIYNAIQGHDTDLDMLNHELKNLQPYKSKLNPEAKSIYMQAINYLIDHEALGTDLDV